LRLHHIGLGGTVAEDGLEPEAVAVAAAAAAEDRAAAQYRRSDCVWSQRTLEIQLGGEGWKRCW
jgi:hypothetical protein